MGVLYQNMIGSKQIDKIVCIACSEKIGEHTKNGLARCLFRVQGTLVAEGEKEAIERNKKKVFEMVDELTTSEDVTKNQFESQEDMMKQADEQC